MKQNNKSTVQQNKTAGLAFITQPEKSIELKIINQECNRTYNLLV